MFESIINFFKRIGKTEKDPIKSKDTAKERLHLVLMQDRANVSADFLDLMKQEIIEVIKKYIDIDENAIDVRLTNKTNGDGTTGAPALYANIPIVSMKDEVKSEVTRGQKREKSIEDNQKVKKVVKKQENEEKIEVAKKSLKTGDIISNEEDIVIQSEEEKSKLENKIIKENTVNSEKEEPNKNVDTESVQEEIQVKEQDIKKEDNIDDKEIKPKKGRKKVNKATEVQPINQTNKNK